MLIAEWILIGALRSPACRRERNWSLCHRRLGKVTAGDETRLFLKVGFGNPPRTNWWASKLLPSFTYQNLIRAAGRCPAAQTAAGPKRRASTRASGSSIAAELTVVRRAPFPPCILAPEDSARPHSRRAFLGQARLRPHRDGGRRGSRRGYRATGLWGHPNKNPGTQRSTSEPRRRRDSGKPAGESIRGEG
jgi:hypothetical protein